MSGRASMLAGAALILAAALGDPSILPEARGYGYCQDKECRDGERPAGIDPFCYCVPVTRPPSPATPSRPTGPIAPCPVPR